MKVAFLIRRIGIRGTDVALFDYAFYNRKLLGNESIIYTCVGQLISCDKKGLSRFMRNFPVRTYKDNDELEAKMKKDGCSVLYCLKYGKKDDLVFKDIKLCVHCVFDMSEPHGDVYAGVSETLARKYGSKVYVPHMISLQPDFSENYRKELGIPDNSLVFGRYGGLDTFNLGFCAEAILELLGKREDVYFLFINTVQFSNHSRIKYLPIITEEKEKNKFIATCDAYLECGTLGHTFGCAIGEFSVHNKPIIVYESPELWNRAHIEILGEKGLYFRNKEEFRGLLEGFRREEYVGRDMNCYREYSPEKVMGKFKEVFLD